MYVQYTALRVANITGIATVLNKYYKFNTYKKSIKRANPRSIDKKLGRFNKSLTVIT